METYFLEESGQGVVSFLWVEVSIPLIRLVL